MMNRNRVHLSSISSLIAKGLNTYVNKIFQLFVLMQKCLKTCFYFVIMEYCDVIMEYCDVIMEYCDVISVCRLMRGKNNLINFIIRL